MSFVFKLPFLCLLSKTVGRGFFPMILFVLIAQGEDYKTVETEIVKKSDLTETIRLIGTIQAKQSTLFVAKSTGIFLRKSEAGSKVARGTVVAHLENNDLQKTVDLSLHSEQIAKEQYERFLSLSKTNAASKQDVDGRLNAWNEAQRSLASAKIELEKTQFLAPYDGIVGVYLKREGTQVQPGDSIVSFYDPSSLIVEFDIPSDALMSIKDNQSVVINGKPFSLTTVQKMIDPETHMSPASVDYAADNCIIGSVVYVDLVLSHKENAIVLPTEASFVKEGKLFVYTVNKEGKLDLIPISVGIRQEDKVEVLSGLNEGDQVVVKNPGRLYPGISIKSAASTLLASAPQNDATPKK